MSRVNSRTCGATAQVLLVWDGVMMSRLSMLPDDSDAMVGCFAGVIGSEEEGVANFSGLAASRD